MRAGRLRDRVTVQEQTTTDDLKGGKREGAWSAVSGMSRISAAVEPLDGTERVAAMQNRSGVTHQVRVRYASSRVSLTAANRLVWHANDGDRTLNLVAAPVIVGNYDELRMEAREVLDG